LTGNTDPVLAPAPPAQTEPPETPELPEPPETAAAEPPRKARHRHRRPKRRLPLWLTIIGWIITIPLAVVAVMRVVAWDDLEPFAVLNTVTAFVYLPAWVVAVVTLIGRHYLLAWVATLVVVAQIAFMLPELTAAEPVPTWAKGAPTIRLLDANVYNVNPSMAGYAREIRAFTPALVTMEEATIPDAAQLEKSGALARLPYRIEVARYDPRAFFVASRYPLSGTHVLYFDGLPLIVQTTIALPSGPQTLWVIHTTAPVPGSFNEWRRDLSEIARLLRARGPHRMLLVGDFNATWGSRGFHAVLDSGLIDGAAARGDALDMTWSQTKHPLPPLVRIDHVLTGPGVAVTRIRTDDGPGSDHRDLLATVAFRSRSG
jgi:endonuclease/exonuclease/phosphatase (EEP) superfamily protein YafD